MFVRQQTERLDSHDVLTWNFKVHRMKNGKPLWRELCITQLNWRTPSSVLQRYLSLKTHTPKNVMVTQPETKDTRFYFIGLKTCDNIIPKSVTGDFDLQLRVFCSFTQFEREFKGIIMFWIRSEIKFKQISLTISENVRAAIIAIITLPYQHQWKDNNSPIIQGDNITADNIRLIH